MTPGPDAPARFAEGDIVRVRTETGLSVIDQPTDAPPTCDPADLAPMTVCCVPVAHVRPYRQPDGTPRWVEMADLSHAEPDDASEQQGDAS